MKTAYAYARFSSDNQREESIDAQLRAIHEYCAQNDIRILREFRDEAFSARTDKRPAFQDMFGLIKEHPADYLIVHKLDRFARNRADAAFYRGKLKEANMKLVSVLERLDDSPESIILEGMLDSLNEYYSANLSRESKKGIKENIINGKRNGGKAPFGYSIVNQHLVPNGDAWKVKELFRMYGEGAKLADISRTLELPFTNHHVVLRNEVYLGTLKSGEWKHEHAHEAIVGKDTFEQCQRRINNSAHNAANRAKIDYMLSGMLVCGYCGKKMIGISAKGQYHYYSCHTKGCKIYRRNELEQRVIHELAKSFTHTSEIKAKFYQLVCDRVNSRGKEKEVEKLRLSLSKRIEKLLASIQYTETPEDAKTILAQVGELRRQMPKQEKKATISREACDAFIEEFFDIENRDAETQKIILRKTIDKILVKEDSLCLFTNTKPPFCITVNKKAPSEEGVESPNGFDVSSVACPAK